MIFSLDSSKYKSLFPNSCFGMNMHNNLNFRIVHSVDSILSNDLKDNRGYRNPSIESRSARRTSKHLIVDGDNLLREEFKTHKLEKGLERNEEPKINQVNDAYEAVEEDEKNDPATDKIVLIRFSNKARLFTVIKMRHEDQSNRARVNTRSRTFSF